MKITSAIYCFDINQVIIKHPFEIKKETHKCYFTRAHRYLKEDIGKPILKSPTKYTYVEVVMIDADEATLREELSKWFINKSREINTIS